VLDGYVDSAVHKTKAADLKFDDVEVNVGQRTPNGQKGAGLASLVAVVPERLPFRR
jgi:hypothetical protein